MHCSMKNTSYVSKSILALKDLIQIHAAIFLLFFKGKHLK